MPARSFRIEIITYIFSFFVYLNDTSSKAEVPRRPRVQPGGVVCERMPENSRVQLRGLQLLSDNSAPGLFFTVFCCCSAFSCVRHRQICDELSAREAFRATRDLGVRLWKMPQLQPPLRLRLMPSSWWSFFVASFLLLPSGAIWLMP